MIVILTSAEDEHADHVEVMLRDRGADLRRFDAASFPSAATITLDYATDGLARQTLSTATGTHDLAEVTAIWYRRPGPPAIAQTDGDELARTYLAEECWSFLRDLWHTLACRWLPAPPATVERAGWKAAQLRVAASLGFELPPTCITNDPAELVPFYRAHGGRIVSKPVAHSFTGPIGNAFVRYTEPITIRDLAAADDLARCPVILQAYVDKRVELRITVVGDRAFAAEIHSQATHHTRVDWRRYDHHQTPIHPHVLPVAVERQCVALVARLGLAYGAIDMIVTPDGRYVFLEINPSGQYLWIEYATGLPISDAIADWLMADERRGPRS